MIDQIDLMARGGTLFLLLLWGWIMVRDHHRSRVAHVTLLLVVTVASHIIADMVPLTPLTGVGLLVLKSGQSAAPAAFWLFARVLFDDDARISWHSWAIVGLSALVGAALLLAMLAWPEQRFAFDSVQRVMWFGFAIAGLLVAFRGRGDDLIEERRRLRLGFVLSVGLCTIAIILSGFLGNWGTLSAPVHKMVNLTVPLLTAGLCAALLGTRRAEFFASVQRPAASADTPLAENLRALAGQIRAHVSSEWAWRDDDMTIGKLALQLGEPEYRVRRAINGELGFRNFAAFLNSYRLAEVKAALLDPAQQSVPILTIALDAGFGSLGPFNRAFRDAEGITPSEYRARSQSEVG